MNHATRWPIPGGCRSSTPERIRPGRFGEGEKLCYSRIANVKVRRPYGRHESEPARRKGRAGKESREDQAGRAGELGDAQDGRRLRAGQDRKSVVEGQSG